MNMNLNVLRLTVVAASLVLAAGCAKKRPSELPPPPATGSGAQQPADADGAFGGAALEALRRDFLTQAGSDTVYFATDSHSIDPASRATLEAQARWLLSHPQVRVTIEGHADERGTREYNLALGDRRASAAKNFLAARGVPAPQMSTLSWGKERPASPGSSEADWARNRRAVTIIPSAN
jgi:peptidoglycan-associated lipoprotein